MTNLQASSSCYCRIQYYLFLIFIVYMLAIMVQSSPPEHTVRKWRQLPMGTPRNIMSEAELAQVKPWFIAPVLSGGLGNHLFQMAAASTLARQRNATCVMGYWDPGRVGSHYTPFGGRSLGIDCITLKHIFPNIIYADFEPLYRHVYKHSVARGMDYHKFPKSMPFPFIRGMFFDPACLLL
jgi:hypothetical protein